MCYNGKIWVEELGLFIEEGSKFPKKTKALLVIEEPTESKILSQYNFIMGESTVPISIGMFIG